MVFLGYSHKLDKYVVHWIDVFGGHFSRELGLGVRTRKGDAVVVEFGKDRWLRNTMTWSSQDQRWSMLIQQRDAKRKWVTFADTRFARVVEDRTVA